MKPSTPEGSLPEDHLRRVLESAKDYAIFSMDGSGTVTSWNAGAERIFGYSAEQIVGANVRVLWTPEDQAEDAHLNEIKAAARDGAAEDKRWHLRRDGSRFFASGMLRPMRDERGEISGFTKVCHDVTTQLTAEQELEQGRFQAAAALKAEQARLEELFRLSPAFMAVLRSADHVFELANDQYYRLIGHREIIGKTVREALPEVVEQGFVELLDSVYQTGKVIERRGERILVERTKGKPCEERYIDFVYQPNRDPDGAIIGIFVQGVDVTERERAEVTARRLASIVDSSDDAIVGKDLSSMVTSWNAGAERIFGYSAQEMVGQSIKRIIPAHLQHQEDEILARISSGQRVDHLETTRQTKGGELRDISVTISPIKDSGGKVVGVSKVARDITERKGAETRLRASEQRFRQLWATTTDAILIMDADQHIEYANPAVEQVFGFTPEEVMTQGLTLLMPERLHEPHRQGMKRYLATGKRKLDWRATEIPALHQGGYEFPIEIAFSHFHEEGRDLFAAFMRDITDRKQAQEALQRSESLFRELADAMPNIVWAAQPDGQVDYYNRRWYEFTGSDVGASGEGSWMPILHPADQQTARESWARSIETGEPYELEFRYRRESDGEYRWHLGRALPVRDGSGAIQRWFGTSTDIHDQKVLQQQNEQLLHSERAARGEAERASRMKDEFLATLSHELRTPLNAILGWVQILSGGGTPAAEDLTQGIEVIERNARAQAKIIEDLLDMSRIISGKIRLDVQRVELASITLAAVESIRPAAEAKGVALSAIIDPAAKPVSGDPNRLQQVFWNLLSNAVKFTPRGGKVQVLLERVNSHLELSVLDTGQGIRPEFLPHVFDRFRQADASTIRKHGGLGLGLAIVKQLVELHGGTVRVKSAGEGTGSTFIVALPLSPINDDDPEVSERRHPAAPSTLPLDFHSCIKLKGVKILVVDDELDARMLVRRLLHECDAIVRIAGSAEEAMDLIAAEVPEVIVSDIGMPGEDGYSLIRRVRALPPEKGGLTPAVALTAYARAEDRMRAVLAGFQMHIAKPVERAELLTMVSSLAARPAPPSARSE